jgi:hypothetical protein
MASDSYVPGTHPKTEKPPSSNSDPLDLAAEMSDEYDTQEPLRKADAEEGARIATEGQARLDEYARRRDAATEGLRQAASRARNGYRPRAFAVGTVLGLAFVVWRGLR